MWVLAPVYFVKTVGMSPLQLVLVGTFMELSVFVFELPTGIVADVYSRRLSTIVGFLIMGLAMVFVGLMAEAWAVIFALWLPIVVGGCVFAAVGVALALLMPERGFKGAERGQTEGALGVMARTGLTGARLVRRTPLLLLILAIAASWGAWSEGYDRLAQAHLLRDVDLPTFFGLSFVVWFGLISAASLILAISVAQPASHRLERVGQLTVTWILLALDIVLIGSVVLFGLAGLFWLAVMAMLLTNVARSLAMPLFTSWLNQSIENSSVRATVMSITSQADTVGQWTGGPAIGAIGNAFGIRAALVIGAFFLTPAVTLYGRAVRHGGREPELEGLAEAPA